VSKNLQFPLLHPTRITPHHRIIPAISKHIAPGKHVPSHKQTVRIEESPPLGIIVAGLEIIQCGVAVIVIAAIAQGIQVGDMALAGDVCSAGILDGNQLAPGIVNVAADDVALVVVDAGDVALRFTTRKRVLQSHLKSAQVKRLFLGLSSLANH